MKRHDVIDQTLDGRGRYLEVGVRGGSVFWSVRADTKVGVDPRFLGRRMKVWVPLARVKRAARMRDGIQLYQETSDEFFARTELASAQYDCILIDGLHTEEQAYRDAINSLEHLASGGLIVMHDCNPQTSVAALDSQRDAWSHPDWNGTWNGTVWKAIVRLRTRTDLNVRVIDSDEGLGIVTRGDPDTVLELSDQEIAALDYPDLVRDRTRLLNLVAPSPMP